MTITIETRVENPRPTTTGVTGGVDYDASLWVTDEAGERSHWGGELTYAPGADGALQPYGGSVDHWIGDSLMDAIRTPWIAAHERLVAAIVRSLGDGPGVETIEVVL